MATTADSQQALRVLRQCPFFEDFGNDELLLLTEFLDVRSGQRGDVLYFEGERGDAMYIVGQGRLELLVNDDAEHARLVGWLGPTESFGELALLLRNKRMLTVRATNDVSLYELSYESFVDLRTQYPEVCLTLVMSIVKRFGNVLSASQELLRGIMLSQLARI